MRLSLVLALLVGGCGSSDGGDPFNRETAQPYVTIVVSPNSAELTPGDTVQLKIRLVRDDGAEPVQGTFDSNNEAVAKVDPNSGLVTAVARGTAMVSAHYGPGTANASITVK